MKLNKIEYWAMNNPLRAWVQENYELPLLAEMLIKKELGDVLEIGCGNGNGTRLVSENFSTNSITAVDLDEKMVSRARKRELQGKIIFRRMDASKLDFPDASFDTAFDFGIIHHIPNWKDCLGELYRVLRPGGKLALEELSAESFLGPVGGIYTLLSKHPYRDMFSEKSLLAELESLGFKIKSFERRNPLGLVLHFSLVAEKPA